MNKQQKEKRIYNLRKGMFLLMYSIFALYFGIDVLHRQPYLPIHFLSSILCIIGGFGLAWSATKRLAEGLVN